MIMQIRINFLIQMNSKINNRSITWNCFEFCTLQIQMYTDRNSFILLADSCTRKFQWTVAEARIALCVCKLVGLLIYADLLWEEHYGTRRTFDVCILFVSTLCYTEACRFITKPTETYFVMKVCFGFDLFWKNVLDVLRTIMVESRCSCKHELQ